MSRKVWAGAFLGILLVASPVGFARYKVHAALADYTEATEKWATTCTDDLYERFREQGTVSVYNAVCGPKGSYDQGSYNEQRDEAWDVVYHYYELALYTPKKRNALLSIALAEGFVEAHCLRPFTQRLVCNFSQSQLKNAQLELELAD